MQCCKIAATGVLTNILWRFQQTIRPLKMGNAFNITYTRQSKGSCVKEVA